MKRKQLWWGGGQRAVKSTNNVATVTQGCGLMNLFFPINEVNVYVLSLLMSEWKFFTNVKAARGDCDHLRHGSAPLVLLALP